MTVRAGHSLENNDVKFPLFYNVHKLGFEHTFYTWIQAAFQIHYATHMIFSIAPGYEL